MVFTNVDKSRKNVTVSGTITLLFMGRNHELGVSAEQTGV